MYFFSYKMTAKFFNKTKIFAVFYVKCKMTHLFSKINEISMKSGRIKQETC